MDELRKKMSVRAEKLKTLIAEEITDAMLIGWDDMSEADWDQIYKGLELNLYITPMENGLQVEVSFGSGENDIKVLDFMEAVRFSAEDMEAPKAYFEAAAKKLEDAAALLRNARHAFDAP